MESQHDERPFYEGFLHLDIHFFLKIPSRAKTKTFDGRYHVYRPDLSNLIKFIEDIASKVLFRDDSMICSIVATKKYDKEPRTEFEVRSL